MEAKNMTCISSVPSHPFLAFFTERVHTYACVCKDTHNSKWSSEDRELRTAHFSEIPES